MTAAPERRRIAFAWVLPFQALPHQRSRRQYPVDNGAENCGLPCHAQLQRNAFPDRRDLGLRPVVCGLPAELSAS